MRSCFIFAFLLLPFYLITSAVPAADAQKQAAE
jgi:hypothetical protein